MGPRTCRDEPAQLALSIQGQMGMSAGTAGTGPDQSESFEFAVRPASPGSRTNTAIPQPVAGSRIADQVTSSTASAAAQVNVPAAEAGIGRCLKSARPKNGSLARSKSECRWPSLLWSGSWRCADRTGGDQVPDVPDPYPPARPPDGLGAKIMAALREVVDASRE
jgi:hypothetical protein